MIVLTPKSVRRDWNKVKAAEAAAVEARKRYELLRSFVLVNGRADLLPDEFASRWKRRIPRGE